MSVYRYIVDIEVTDSHKKEANEITSGIDFLDMNVVKVVCAGIVTEED